MYYISEAFAYRQVILQMTSPQLFALTICHIVCFLSSWFFCIAFVLIFSMANSTLLTLLLIFYIKSKQIYTLIQQKVASKLPLKAVSSIEGHLIHSTSFFFAIDRMYRGVFLNSLLILAPANALLSALLLLNQSSNQLFIGSCIAYVFCFIFALHLLLAHATKAIHRPARLLIRLAVRLSPSPSGAQTRSRLKLAHLIVHFHTVNRLGFHYGKFGIVSTNSFAKVSWVWLDLRAKGHQFPLDVYCCSVVVRVRSILVVVFFRSSSFTWGFCHGKLVK